MKTLLIGKTGVGKTTLIQRLKGEDLSHRKTQTIEYHMNFIDTPGEYLEHREFYRALIVTAVDADFIGFMQGCGDEDVWLPPAFAMTFARPVFGIVSKSDLARNDEDIRIADEVLRCAGAQRTFVVSAAKNTGIDELREYLGGETVERRPIKCRD